MSYKTLAHTLSVGNNRENTDYYLTRTQLGNIGLISHYHNSY